MAQNFALQGPASASFRPALPRLPRLPTTVAALLRKRIPGLFDHYRPERHYMRGPGPKWREKHPNG